MKLRMTDIKELVRKIPVELRNAARKERAIINKEMKQNPIVASFKLSHGQYNLKNNVKLQEEVTKLLETKAPSTYAETATFFQRQPMGTNLNIAEELPEVVLRQPKFFN